VILLGADAIAAAARAAGARMTADHLNRLARTKGITCNSIGSSHAKSYDNRILVVFRDRKIRKSVERLYASVAAAGSDFANAGSSTASAGATPALSETGTATDLSLNELPAFMRDRTIARSTILSRLREFGRHAGISDAAARVNFLGLYSDRGIDISPDIRERFPRLSAPSLKRWSKAFASGGLVALANVQGGGNRRGCGRIESNPAVADLVVAMVTHFGAHLRVPRVVEAIAARFPDLETPSRGAVARFIRGWRTANPSLALALHNPDGWRSRHRIKIADAGADITRLNQRWELDSTPGDIELLDGRYQILTVIDVYSRRVMFHVAPSESAHATIQLLCRAMLAWGVPESIGGDNSRAFLSKHSQAFLADIGITYDAARKFTPTDKGYVESVQGTMSHELLPMLPGFCGHSVAQRQELRARTSFASRFGATTVSSARERPTTMAASATFSRKIRR